MRVSPTLLFAVAFLVAQANAGVESEAEVNVPLVGGESSAAGSGQELTEFISLAKVPATSKGRCCGCIPRPSPAQCALFSGLSIVVGFAIYMIFMFGLQEIIACSLTAAATAYCFKPS